LWIKITYMPTTNLNNITIFKTNVRFFILY
jgi:hypothetical protein